jgi:replication initiation protein RepC
MTFEMLAARDLADRFEGVPKGMGKPLTFLAAFQEAEPLLGLPPQAFKLVTWLVKQTVADDWEEGSRPIAWPSARRQQEFLGLSAAGVKMLNRVLFERGIFVIRDNAQGKRYGRRDANGRIIEAYGFDLSPLAYRYDEFVRLAANAKAERRCLKELRARVTIARRAIRQAGDMLAALDALPPDWTRLAGEAAALVKAAAGCARSDHLGLAATQLESLKAEAEEWVRQAAKPVETNPVGLVDEPHTTSTNLPVDLKDTVIATEGSSAAGRPVPDPPTGGRREDQGGQEPTPSITTRLKLSVEELIQLVPRLGGYITGNRPSWRDAVDAAGGPLRHELGVSGSLWAEACHLMGRDGATLALAVVAAKAADHFTSSPAGYFAGMVRKAEKGQLFLEKTLFGLRTAKYGRPISKGAGGKGHWGMA